MSYISVVYNRDRTRLTKYPGELITYLLNRYGIKRGQMLIDIGCGRGDHLLAFREAGLLCCGVDIYNSVDGKVNVRTVDVSQDMLPFKSDSIDVVFHKSLIEHLASPDNLMKETMRVLKRGGRVIIMTPDWHSQMKVFYEDPTHIHPYNTLAIQDLLCIHGFKNVESELFYQLPSVWKHKSIKAISRMIRTFLPVTVSRASGIKFLRWSVELMVLGSGVKP